MGRIEDALQKLQRAGARQTDARTSVPARIATVVAADKDYAGKRLTVDVDQLRSQGLLAPNSDERSLAEQYRVIKRPLLHNADLHRAGAERGNLLMIGSALSGEGKTFTCLNLCLSIAREKDWSVVLVDGDCSKPHLTRLFSAEKEPGLVDLLRDPSVSFNSVVMPTDVPGLAFVPAGARDPHASELLASRRMDEVCLSLAQEHANRMVIFDSSPLLLTTESPVLASKVGQVAVVVRANSTPRQAVVAALETLDSSKPIGCILNQVFRADLTADYGSYGDYGLHQ